MRSRTLRRNALSLTAAAATLISAVAVATPAQARPVEPATTSTTTGADQVATITETLARQIAGTLHDRAARARIVSAVADGPADLLRVAPGSALARQAADANRALLVAKGLPAETGSLLRLRLAHPDLRAALRTGAAPLVAAAPTDDVTTAVTAYTHTGRSVQLDPVRLPGQAVLVVEVDTEQALDAGLRLMRTELDRHGLTSARSAEVSATGGYWATKVNAVRLNDDMEPWIKGDAEIYNLVAGFGRDGKVRIDVVQMPYLNNDGTTYYPNQLLVHYNNYKYNLADVVMMEDDGDTNYQALVTALISALLYIVDGGAYTPLVNAILNAIPTSWWTDDPDYTESWYTLSTNTSGRRYGASGNGWMDLSPYWVSEL